MEEQNFKSDEGKLSGLLRDSRENPTLPPRFRENVWRRIESTDVRSIPVGDANWFDAVAAWFLRPRLALAMAAVLVLTGLGLGWSKGEQLARQGAQARYVAAVAPNSLR